MAENPYQNGERAHRQGFDNPQGRFLAGGSRLPENNAPVPHFDMGSKANQRKRGFSLTELVCVIAIIAILLALYLGPISKAFIHVKKFLSN